MAAAQPISFFTSNHGDAGASTDYPMDMGSYNDSGSGTFNPASYTRHFLGSPLSWRAGSINAGRGFPNGSPMQQFMGSLEAREFKFKPSSSIEAERGILRNDLQVFDKEGELCRDYWCCGVHLPDFHALIEHFEEIHVQVVEHPSGSGQTSQIQIPFNPQPAQSTSTVAPSSTSNAATQIQNEYSPPFDVDDMEIDTEEAPSMSSRSSPSSMSEVTTPPDTPVTTPSTGYPAGYAKGFQTASHSNLPSPFGSQPPSPGREGHVSTRPHLNLNLSAFSRSSTPQGSQSKIEPFNAYARHMQGDDAGSDSYPETEDENCVPPAVLHSSSGPTPKPMSQAQKSPTPDSAPSTPTLTAPPTPSSSTPMGGPTPPGMSANAAKLSASLSRPAASLLLSKPHKCPKPNCTKSYKQANGLKYHMTHGSCNFAPSKDLEHVQALLERKRRDRAAAAIADGADPSLLSPTDSPLSSAFPDFGQISESELREVEIEAEKRLRPFACGVGDCSRRYKNMNGLRYHYQHSGEHGAIGLTMLASGTHECLNHGSGSRDNSATRGERESRKAAKAKVNSVPPSRSNSVSSRPALTYTQYPNADPVPPASAFASASQAQAQLAYQQRYAEHQRAQFAQQQQQQQQQPEPQPQNRGPPKLTFGQTYSIKTEAA